MGVTNLKKLLKHERNIYLDDLKRTVDNISSIRGVGVVDISGWLVTFLTSNLAIANLWHRNPPVSLYTELAAFLNFRIKFLNARGIRPFMVFDNSANPNKSATNSMRKEQNRKKIKELADLMEDPNFNIENKSDALKMNKLKKSSVTVREDITHDAIYFCQNHNVPYIMAVNEADPQLKALLEHTDFVITADSDLVGLGSKTCVFDLNFSSGPLSGQCTILTQNEMQKAMHRYHLPNVCKYTHVTVSKLKSLCRDAGLLVGGNKQALITRLNDHDSQNPRADEDSSEEEDGDDDDLIYSDSDGDSLEEEDGNGDSVEEEDEDGDDDEEEQEETDIMGGGSNVIAEFTRLQIAVFLSFLGNDYVATSPKPKIMWSKFLQLDSQDVNSLNSLIEESSLYFQSDREKYIYNFNRSLNCFQYAPVWRIKLSTDKGNNHLAFYEKFLAGTYTISLDSLQPLANSTTRYQRTFETRWSELIGYNAREELYKFFLSTSRQPTYFDLSRGTFYAKNGKKFNDMALIRPTNLAGQFCQFGSIINWGSTLVNNWDTATLIHFLHCRNINITNRTRQQIVAIVNNNLTREPDLAIEAPPSEYVTLDLIEPDVPPEYYFWNDPMMAVIRNKLQFVELDNAYMAKIFGAGRYNTQERGELRFTFGSYIYDTLKFAHVTGKLNGSMYDFYYFNIKCSPSMKSIPWEIRLVFYKTKNSVDKYMFLEAPSSLCQCPDGLYFCSHMYGFCLWLRLFQMCSYSCKICKEQVFPLHIQTKVLFSIYALLDSKSND